MGPLEIILMQLDIALRGRPYTEALAIKLEFLKGAEALAESRKANGVD